MSQEIPSALIVLPVMAIWMAILHAPPFRIFADDQPRRFVTIDGIRGLLAVSVFAHHFAITMQWQQRGVWELTPSHAWNTMGNAAVTLFFMITGFLFFGKISDPRRNLDLLRFLKSRLLRIYPVFLTCLCGVAFIALTMADRSITLMGAIKSVVWWLIFCPGQIFGMSDAGLAVAYTPWSLRYEWLFYLSLPLLAWVWRCLKYHPAFVVSLCIGTLSLAYRPVQFQHAPFSFDTRFIAPFTLGGLALILTRDERLCRVARGPLGSMAAISTLIALCFRGEPYTVKTYLAMIVVFVPVAAGASLFGLLKSRAMLILGAISYDVYILHGLVLFVAFHILSPAGLIGISPVLFAIYLTLVGMIVIALSIAVHRFIEVPSMNMSARLRGADPRERLAAP